MDIHDKLDWRLDALSEARTSDNNLIRTSFRNVISGRRANKTEISRALYSLLAFHDAYAISKLVRGFWLVVSSWLDRLFISTG